jgi:branched-chain amino acid transport system permease protein|tara:strand:+ start:1120 stop:2118 length:999 start_codon:yes stop_codon:yes gene_type:complete
MTRRGTWILLIGVGVLALAAGLILEGYSLRVLTLGLIAALAVLGLNLIFGYCGLIHLGQAGFVGIGAYTSAILTTKAGWSMAASIPTAVAVTALAAGLISVPLLRLKGHYLALATVGVNVVLELVAKNWVELTNGYNGIAGIPRLAEAVSDSAPERTFLVIATVTLLLGIGLSARLRDSHLGRAMIAVRDDETAAMVAGVNVVRVRVTAFVLGAVLAAVSGVLFAHYTGFISPTDFGVPISILYLVMIIVGGEASIGGVVAGAVVMTFLPELLRDAAERLVAIGLSDGGLIVRLLDEGYLAVYGLITLLVLVFMPKGLAGLVHRLSAKAEAT